ncbi:MAG TPA: MerR family transcriptional regulator [Nocardioides sp.]|nr:MerR family transcriptional regulator [Nocardioides sp.]
MSAATPIESPRGEVFDDGGMTVDELAAAAGLTVRTTRYYATLGLIPPPERRGRLAWYGATHLARLEMIRALQEHGFTLQAIEGFVGSIPADATLEDLAVQRAMLTSWTVKGPRDLTRRQLEQHARRRLTDEELQLVVELGLVRVSRNDKGADRYTPIQGFDVGVQVLDLDIPMDGMRLAGQAIARAMGDLAQELSDIMRDQLFAPYRAADHTAGDAARFERTVAVLRQLTLDAIVGAFQRSTNDLVARSIQRR